MRNLTVIVPVFNEEAFLEQSLNRLINLNKEFSILIIDDCSFDNSPKIAKKFEEKYSNIRLITKNKNEGKGSVLKEAIKHTNTEFCVVHDSDLEYFPEDIVSMYKKVNKDSFVLGSRFIGNLERKNIYKRTYYANKIMSYFFSLVFFKKVTDVATCYKMFPTNSLKNYDIRENGFSIEIEILAKLLKSNLNLIEEPIKYEGRSYEEGKKIKVNDGIFYLINTLKYRFNKRGIN